MRTIFTPTFFLIFLVFFTACSKPDSKSVIKFQGSTMGTQYHIVIVPEKNQNDNINESTIELQKQVDALLLEINQQMSTYISDSEISKFNRYQQLDWFPVSKDLARVVSSAQAVSKITQGAFDITIAPLIDLWGFGSKVQLATPTDEQIKNALQKSGYQRLEVRNESPALRKRNNALRIDLSAIAKGFAVDTIAEFLNQNQYNDYLVEIGGELRNRGFNPKGKPWKIGIQSPENEAMHIKHRLLTSNLAIATSGDYRNYFIKDGVRYSHTINPVTGKPVAHNLASISVLHESAMMADAYATALMVLGDEKGKAFAKKHQLRVNMVTRGAQNNQHWQNIDDIKIPQSLQKCESSASETTSKHSDDDPKGEYNEPKLGCVYLE